MSKKKATKKPSKAILDNFFTGDHKTVTVTQSFEVDEGMVEVVNWLNKYADVHTEFCCEGDEDGEPPYVLFRCTDLLELGLVARHLHMFGTLRVSEPNYCIPYVRFHMTFSNKTFLEEFKKYIGCFGNE